MIFKTTSLVILPVSNPYVQRKFKEKGQNISGNQKQEYARCAVLLSTYISAIYAWTFGILQNNLWMIGV